MAKFPLYQWKKATGGSSTPIDATNFAKKNEANTFTQANTFNNAVSINSGNNDFTWDTTRNWNQNLDNTIVKTKDLKWVQIFTYSSPIQPPVDSWNETSWNWTLSNLTATNGINEFILVFSYRDDIACTLRGDVVWKSGLTESRSQIITTEKNGRTFYFQFVIKNDNKFRIYIKQNNVGTGAEISWVRGWIKRGVNLPTKTNTLW